MDRLGGAGVDAVGRILDHAGHRVYRADDPLPDLGALAVCPPAPAHERATITA
jgi:hypothetical protein